MCSAVPGAVTSALSEAPNALIRDGARLIRSSTDLLDDLGIEAWWRGSSRPRGSRPIQMAVLAALERPMMAEEVSRAAGLGFPDAVAALISLEIRGLVTGDGGRYRRAVELGSALRLPEPG